MVVLWPSGRLVLVLWPSGWLVVVSWPSGLAGLLPLVAPGPSGLLAALAVWPSGPAGLCLVWPSGFGLCPLAVWPSGWFLGFGCGGPSGALFLLVWPSGLGLCPLAVWPSGWSLGFGCGGPSGALFLLSGVVVLVVVLGCFCVGFGFLKVVLGRLVFRNLFEVYDFLGTRCFVDFYLFGTRWF